MIGAIIGDIVGSRFEWHNCRKRDFELFSEKCHFTDDTVMSLSVAKAILKSSNLETLKYNTIKYMQAMVKNLNNGLRVKILNHTIAVEMVQL